MAIFLYYTARFAVVSSYLMTTDVDIPLVLEDANLSNSERAVYPEHTTSKSKAYALSFKGRKRDSPLENPHRAKKALEVASSPLQVPWVYK